MQGAKVLGVEGKTINVKKCEFVKSVLGIKNLSFVKDDAMKVTKKKYGTFDVVVALGLLYHLDDPFTFLENISKLCTGFLILDTHVALREQPTSSGGWKPDVSPEFDPDATQLAKDLSVGTSLKNEQSAWLTEDSLVALLHDVGFEQVSKFVFPERDNAWWSDTKADARVLLLVIRKRNSFKSRVH